MNSTDIKDYVVAILTKSKQLDEVPLEYIEEVEKVLQKMATAGGGGIAGMPNDGAGAGVVKEEFVKIDDMGQWSIEKTIKPGPALNYTKMNKPTNTEDNPANALDYKQVNSASIGDEQAAREAKYKKKQNTMIGGTPEKDAAAKEMVRRRAAFKDSASNGKTAIETIKGRKAKRV